MAAVIFIVCCFYYHRFYRAKVFIFYQLVVGYSKNTKSLWDHRVAAVKRGTVVCFIPLNYWHVEIISCAVDEMDEAEFPNALLLT